MRGSTLRLGTVILALILTTPAMLGAQVEIGLRGGVQIDRHGRPDRVLRDAGMREMFAADGEAGTFAGRVGYRFGDGWSAALDVAHSANDSWFGHTPVPPAEFHNRTTFVSARLLYGVGLLSWLELDLGAGPAYLIRHGTGQSLLVDDDGLGLVFELTPRFVLSRSLRLDLSLSDYVSRPEFREPFHGQFVGEEVRPAGHEWQQDFVLLVGFALRP